MPLNKSNLKNNIVKIMTQMIERENISIEEFADRMSSAIDHYIKDADISYETGLTSATGGVVTGTFYGKLK